MIGSGLKKLARENGLKISHGVAYGNVRGYAVTMDEGAGFKRLCIATAFSEIEQENTFQQTLNDHDLTGLYRIQQYNRISNGIVFTFGDTMGTIKKITDFMDFLFPLLEQHGAEKACVCNECHSLITDDGAWILRNGVFSSHVHTACQNIAQQRIQDEKEQQEEAIGSYITGIFGALLGAVLGSIVWAFVLSIGYVASIVGLLIGFLAEKGYCLLKGRQGKAKIAILILAVILGVLLGTLGGYTLQVLSVMNDEGIAMEFFGPVLELVMMDSDVQTEMISSFLMGLVFAGLGVFGMLHRQSKQLQGEKIQTLK